MKNIKLFFKLSYSIFYSYGFRDAFFLFINYIYLIVCNRIFKNKNSQRFLSYQIAFPYRPSMFGLLVEIFFLPFPVLNKSNDKILVFDCGANIGIRTLFFKWIYPNCKIKCFEPNPVVLSYLEKNIKNNNLDNDVEIIPSALGNDDNFATLRCDGGVKGLGSSNIVESSNEKMSNNLLKVPIRRLSNYIDSAVDLLKLDIEGSEYDVVKELINSGKISRVSSFLIECHEDKRLNDNSIDELIIFFKNNSYGVECLPSFIAVDKDGYSTRTQMIYCIRNDK